ncbi:unnamed protein product [Phyllotreta striolata]|uniref:Uncharacterized protein n=1 Tax=Phyllotreta striolata TaxID=444603 RepID=A0A9N9XJL3_PHYSR|nr:unnamed protein product [Phyllotreta striolata]
MAAQWHHPNLVKMFGDEITDYLENTCWNPPKPPELEKKITYFNNTSTHHRTREYDLYFAFTKVFPLWDQRKNRCNRMFIPDVRENIFEQEKHKQFPVVTSMIYGRPCRVPYDTSEPAFRRANVMADFRRRTGVMMVKERKPV